MLQSFQDHKRAINRATNIGDIINFHGYGNEAQASLSRIQTMDQGARNSAEARVIQFSQEINDFIYPSGEFMMKSVNDPVFAASGQTRRINEGVEGIAAVKGRFHPLNLANGANAPVATPTVRKNNNRDVQIEYFRVDPQVNQMERSMEVPYDSRGELLRSHAEVLTVAKANHTAVQWGPNDVGSAVVIPNSGNANFVFTSGTERPNPVSNTTGNVHGLAYADLVRVPTAFNCLLYTSDAADE